MPEFVLPRDSAALAAYAEQAGRRAYPDRRAEYDHLVKRWPRAQFAPFVEPDDAEVERMASATWQNTLHWTGFHLTSPRRGDATRIYIAGFMRGYAAASEEVPA